METLLSVLAGLGLAAACGFRVFVPLLVASIAAYTGHLGVADGFEWIGSLPALITFAVATVAEVVGYYVPWVDNLLDTIAVPAAMVAGVLASASVIVDVPVALRWTLALIGGGGAAGLLQGATAAVRLKSSATTAGTANPLIATGELAGSATLSILAVIVPVLAVVLIVAALFAVYRIAGRLAARRRRGG